MNQTELIEPTELIPTTSQWYQNLVDDCKTIIVERKFNASWEVIQCKWEVGDRILQDHGEFERAKIYGDKIVQHVAQSLSCSPRDIWYCLQFRKKYPDLNTLPEGKAISWRRIVNEYLPEKDKVDEQECKHLNIEVIVRCRDCGKRRIIDTNEEHKRILQEK